MVLPRKLSRRFLSVQDLTRAQPNRAQPNRAQPHPAWGPGELFAEGQWQTIRARLECEGWSQSQIDHMHDQLRQGWPLVMAKRNVAVISGHCPLAARRER